jgi:hypothetical protein
MKKKIVLLSISVAAFAIPVNAQVVDIISIVNSALAKVVQAVDLEVQKLQTETIWLQNAQKTLENTMTELRLNDISAWVQKQRDLYQEYYDELWQVKEAIARDDRLRTLILRQGQIVTAYRNACDLVLQDKNFSPAEISYMSGVYNGILDQSLENLDQVLLVSNAFVTQMSDAQRMQIIDMAATSIERNYNDLRSFNNENLELSIQRSMDKNDLETVKRLFGIH